MSDPTNDPGAEPLPVLDYEVAQALTEARTRLGDRMESLEVLDEATKVGLDAIREGLETVMGLLERLIQVDANLLNQIEGTRRQGNRTRSALGL